MGAHSIPVTKLLQELEVDPRKGLSAEEAALRLERDGENTLHTARKRGILLRFLLQLRDPMVILLLIAALVSFVVALLSPEGEFIDSVVIMSIVLLNAVLGVVQESRAERALSALSDLSAPTARALRGGVVRTLPAAQLVRGDIVLLEAGDSVPADLRLLESADLRCDESALTGESVPSRKNARLPVEHEAALGDRANMVFAGCTVAHGRGVGVATGTGMDTEMGRIASLLAAEKETQTPLQQRLKKLGKQLGLLVLGVCAVIFVLGLFQGIPAVEMLMTAVSLAVAAVPEGLAAVVTVVLALGVQRMAGRGAIVRSLPAVETLGSASVICSDKTGTLTQNRMTVLRLWAVGQQVEQADGPVSEAALHLLRLGTLCSDGRVERDEDGTEHQVGDPTETAIVAAAGRKELEKADLEEEFPRICEIPFDSGRKRMTTVHLVGGRALAIVKGGLDVLLPLCRGVDEVRVRAVGDEMAAQALRVLAVACRELPGVPGEPDPDELEQELTFMGLIGMMDPPREESADAVKLCAQAGIRTVMITGDHLGTATAIAGTLGILRPGDRAIDSAELRRMTQQQLQEKAQKISVYARVTPEDKIRIVKAWQYQGAVVAMTGDGVNDAPALKAADIGCAMGATGTDVAREAADMVLTDDNFATVAEAVRQGRGIYDNIRKTVQFLLGCNLGEVLAVFAAMLLGWGTPLLAVHLLLVNVVTDALPALALGVEPAEQDVMRRSPVPRGEDLFAGKLGLLTLLQGIMIGLLTLVAYYIGAFVALSPLFVPGRGTGMTMAFLVLSLSQLVQAQNCRSTQSLFRVGLFSNKAMNKGILVSLAVLLIITLVPALEAVFHLQDLSMRHWLVLCGISLVPFVVSEVVKIAAGIRRRLV